MAPLSIQTYVLGPLQTNCCFALAPGSMIRITVIRADADILQMDNTDNEWIEDIKKQAENLTAMTNRGYEFFLLAVCFCNRHDDKL